MQIRQLAIEYKNAYSDFVTTHESGSFLQSWSWGDFQTQQGKTAVRYGIFEKELIGTVQFLLTKIPHLPGEYLYTAYGPLFKTSSIAQQEECIRLLCAQARADFPNVWFIRFEPKEQLNIVGETTVHIQPGATLVTDLTLSEQELLGNMHNKTRYNIKIAAKHEVTVETISVQYDEAIALLSQTSERQHYTGHAASYYRKMLEYFDNNRVGSEVRNDCAVHMYQAKYKGICIASALIIDHGNTRTYLFGGSDNAYKNVMAPYALHWQAMRDAQSIGLTQYDWWGIETASGTTPGFVQFKLRWGGTQKHYPATQDIVFNKTWYRAYKALRYINRFI